MGEDGVAATDVEIPPCSSQTPTSRAGLRSRAAFPCSQNGFCEPRLLRTARPHSWQISGAPESGLHQHPFLLAFLKESFADVLPGDRPLVRTIPHPS